MEAIKTFFGNLFASNPGSDFGYYPEMLILAVLLIAGGTIFGLIYDKKKKNDPAFKKLFKKSGRRTVMFGILFLILVAVRYENIPYFAMRLWLYLAFLLLAWHFIHVIRVYKKVYPRERDNVQIRMASRPKSPAAPKYGTGKKHKKKKRR